MLIYLAKRLLWMIPVLLGITIISFGVMHLAPGDITTLETSLNPQSGQEAREQLREAYNLDEPLHVQYGLWLKRVVALDFGESFSSDNRPVLEKIGERLPVTLAINIASLLLILAVALPVGVISAVRQNSLLDRSLTVTVFLAFAIPGFWLALLLMVLFGVQLGWLPVSGIQGYEYDQLDFWGKLADRARHLVLPVVVSAFAGIAAFSRYVRSNMLEVIRQDYVLTARAKGLPEGAVIYRHALRNALLPVITLLGLSVPGLIGGSVIFETIFGIPGMGQLFYNAVLMRDYPVVMGILVIGAILTLLGNLLADLAYAWADPRVRRGLTSS
ncbi:diguanylate cyclase [Thiohalorhabdus denitrificans]|uniref:Peptide/nickel transport system permease protein n=1 Tax=Thiohalorhabdus denitrificans TaxID=381306 RepID=A0A0P9E9W3_9GAMM|nr:ABC transporter permease [Thiohalorhabdus denitrificans]KPV39154.1 diguanylate cyclase [Thiohalorhabdus denitrificans]SCX76213.1 peptide/nickel transport system permease protein [Thiohalorhabdus denitrificans]